MVRKLSFDSSARPPVGTAEDFVAELRRLRAQVGEPSFRELHRIAGKRIADDAHHGYRANPLSPSTTSEVLGGKRLPRLPRLEFVESFVAACLYSCGTEEPAVAVEVARWRTLWQSLATTECPQDSNELDEPAKPMQVDRPRPRRPLTLPLVVVAFIAGLGVGIMTTWQWRPARQPPAAGATASAEPSAEVPDVCVASQALPTGRDVLQLPPAGQTTGSWWTNEPGAATLSTDGRWFRADVAAGTSRPGDVIIVKSDVALVQGGSYVLTFIAAADRATAIRVRVQDSRPPAYQASFDREVSVDRSACVHLYRFVATRTSTHSELTFQVGGRAHDFRLHVSDASLIETSA